ncbi:hypothetical protein EVAR_40493_1 [Eumeta japonica]|uniref:Uncharacterized protein n=1 Tax=Eumeta variegata TaxID=151549 RepID=A0A4C1XYU7_EUMVA|nr:hypothetical protein EVAR_40493_1 [Eumeta japonica]
MRRRTLTVDEPTDEFLARVKLKYFHDQVFPSVGRGCVLVAPRDLSGSPHAAGRAVSAGIAARPRLYARRGLPADPRELAVASLLLRACPAILISHGALEVRDARRPHGGGGNTPAYISQNTSGKGVSSSAAAVGETRRRGEAAHRRE